MLMTNLNKFRRLSRSDRRLYLQSVLLLPVIHCALTGLGYARLRALMERWIPLKSTARPVSESEAYQRASDITRIVSVAAQHGFYRASCLRKSLLTWGFLRRDGITSALCFGVRMSDRRLEAHAWLEYNGMVLNDSANIHEQYQALDEALPGIKLGL